MFSTNCVSYDNVYEPVTGCCAALVWFTRPLHHDISNPPPFRLTSRKPLWRESEPVDINSQWRESWKDSDQCSCGETQTMSHIVESCPQTRLHGGLSKLHSADDDVIA